MAGRGGTSPPDEDIGQGESVMESSEESVKKSIIMEKERSQCSECGQNEGEEWLSCGKCWRRFHGDCLNITMEDKQKAKCQYWTCHKCALWERTSQNEVRQLKEKVEEIQGYVMVPPKMEITDELKTLLREQAREIVQANSQNLADEIDRLERNIEKRISMMETNFKKDLHDMIKNVSVKDQDMMWKNKYHQAKQELSDSKRQEKQLDEELAITRSELQTMKEQNQSLLQEKQNQAQQLLDRRYSHDLREQPMNLDEDSYAERRDNYPREENRPSLFVTWSEVTKRRVQHRPQQFERRGASQMPSARTNTLQFERRPTFTQTASASSENEETRPMTEDELGAVGGFQDTSVRNLSQHESEMQDLRKSTFGILRDLRNKDNEDRARQPFRDTPTELRKRARSMSRERSRERERRVKFKLEIAKTKIQVISDSQLKFVVVDDSLEELWVRKGWDNYVAIMRGFNASDIRQLIQYEEIDTRETDVIILSAGSNDLQYYINEDKIRRHQDRNEIQRENSKLIEAIAQDVTIIAQRLVEKDKIVYWISPPLHSRRDEAAYIELEETVLNMGKNIANFHVINVAGKMVEEIMQEQDRKKVIEKFMGDEDVNHLNKKMTRTILLDIISQYESRCDIVEGAKAGDLLRREDLIKGSCWACGSSVHQTRDCRRREDLVCEICDRRGHNTKVCILQFKMCHYCGRKGQHYVKKCEGWWNKLRNWRGK